MWVGGHLAHCAAAVGEFGAVVLTLDTAPPATIRRASSAPGSSLQHITHSDEDTGISKPTQNTNASTNTNTLLDKVCLCVCSHDRVIVATAIVAQANRRQLCVPCAFMQRA